MIPTVRGTTRVVGVWGYPVKHSASPAMHNAAFAALGLDWVYVPFEVAPDRVAEAVAGIRALNLVGVNVTIPLKELVPPHLDDLTERASALGAVNTIIHRDGTLIGDSTDGPGFLTALEHAGIGVGSGSNVVVLGAGGSARALVRALTEAGASVTLANRNQERASALAAEVALAPVTVIPLTEDAVGAALVGADVLVNTTSVGMYPETDALPPVPADALAPSVFVADLIYNPAETRLLSLARSRGCRTQNGIEMLVRQGAISFHHWTGIHPPVDVMRQAVEETLGLTAKAREHR
ncbi:MAG: shikimate dehydrogenase [Armatimonadaceae bacterium]